MARQSSASGTGASPLQSALAELLKVYQAKASKGVSPEETDAITQAMLLAVGSAASAGAVEAMTAAGRHLADTMHNAVASQQKTNIEAMAVTAECVRKILGSTAPRAEPDETTRGEG